MKKAELLRKKIQEIDKLFEQMEALRSKVLIIMDEKRSLEKQIIKLFRKSSFIDSIETTDRVYRVEKQIRKDDREKVIEHLSNHLLEQGIDSDAINNIDAWKRKMFKTKKRSKLIVLRKV